MKKFFSALLTALAAASSCLPIPSDKELAVSIQSDPDLEFVQEKAREIVRQGFTAGDGYEQVWIRDLNTFIELACDVHDSAAVRETLLVFLALQADSGGIVDAFVPADTAGKPVYACIYSDLEPRYAGFKNTVETDQETSLVQAVYKYIRATGDAGLLDAYVGRFTVAERLELALDFLMSRRYSARYGLIFGAATADWGDVQPEDDPGVFLTENTHYAVDVYDNAMFVIALENLMALVPAQAEKWGKIKKRISATIRESLWDCGQQKFIPHLYLSQSPFPPGFDEHSVYYHGGTAVAIEAGLLARTEIKQSLAKMVANVQACGAATIGLTLYPAYPEGAFKNPGMQPYCYQNGGDWGWFGGRMIQQLIRHGFVREAYEQARPMMRRVRENNGFYEWYTIDNQPRGSGSYRGEAGVLYGAARLFEEWAETLQSP